MAKKPTTTPGNPQVVHGESDGLSVTAHRGDGSVMLAFDVEDKPTDALAGFAVKRTTPGGQPRFLLNRLNFTQKITSATTPAAHKFTPTNEAPFQKFRWVDFPPVVEDGEYLYEVTEMLFASGGGLKTGRTTRVTFDLVPKTFPNFEMGFTRAFLSSQAYADRFDNADIRPKGKKTFDYDTAPFEKQYEWLGYHARKMVMGFLDEAVNDPAVTLDAFAYDLDEPDVIRKLSALGPRLRLFLDNASLHTKDGAVEPLVQQLIEGTAGDDNVKVGHFKRFAHNKVFVLKRNGAPVKVLTGSANFSVRGLYVQANNVLVFDDPTVAGLFAQAFDQAFTDKSKSQAHFAASPIASKWHDIAVAGVPPCRVAFSPHQDSALSLDPVAKEVKNADNSVLFAIMELGGSGPVLDAVKALDTQNVFTFGVTQTSAELKVFTPGSTKAKVVPFAFLDKKVPPPFNKEISGGQGQVVHHKFVVVDFNDSDPILFTGSSNLAAGGEESNGDNLFAITDRGVVTSYAVEAVRLLDHYHFRAKMKAATKDDPLTLQGPDDEGPRWWEGYYDKANIKFRERTVFAK
jgi:phosphatidylserine/phosphatidylglycerophosphate/cardiolipin synthase-like enzyme